MGYAHWGRCVSGTNDGRLTLARYPRYRDMSDFIARIDREHGPSVESVKITLHESVLGSWRGFFFCGGREHYRVGEVLRLAVAGGRPRTAVVYATEQIAGKSMWVVDVVGADARGKAPHEADRAPHPPDAAAP